MSPFVVQEWDGFPIRFFWPYLDQQQECFGYVARFDHPNGGKKIIPFFRRNGPGFNPGAAAIPRPLFGLNTLGRADIDSSLFIVEGEKCAQALHTLGFAAVTSQGGSHAAAEADWTPLSGVSDIVILPDNDEPGLRYTSTVVEQLSSLPQPPGRIRVCHLPGLAHSDDVADWIQKRVPAWDGFSPINQIHLGDLKSALIEAVATNSELSEQQSVRSSGDNWAVPLPLDSFQIPPWPKELFPLSIQRFADALANATETPIDLSISAILAIVATATQGRFQVEVKPGYSEPLAVWTLCAMPSGSRKSAVFKSVCEPLLEYESKLQEAVTPKRDRAIREAKALDMQIARLRNSSKEKASEEVTAIEAEIRKLEEIRPTIPSLPQFFCSDATPEGLALLLVQNAGKISILDDEGGVLGNFAGRYSRGVPNFDVALKGHSNSSIRVNRRTQDPLVINSPHLTLGLCVQPEVLREIVGNSAFREKGFVARLLMLAPPSNLGNRTCRTSPVSAEVVNEYKSTIQRLLEFSYPMNELNEASSITSLRLDDSALETMQAFEMEIEENLASGGKFQDITDWAGKLLGATARIAGHLHLLQHSSNLSNLPPISNDTVRRAIEVAEVFAAHALQILSDTPHTDIAHAKKLLLWIARKKRISFSLREAFNENRTRLVLSKASDAERILKLLCDAGYLRLLESKRQDSRSYLVNPTVLHTD